jgi:hypothetical protein
MAMSRTELGAMLTCDHIRMVGLCDMRIIRCMTLGIPQKE